MATVRGLRRRTRPDFISRTVVGVTGAVERAVYNEAYARRTGLLQRVDPRVKLAVFIAAVLTIALARSLPVLAGLYAVVLALGLLSCLPAKLLLGRVLVGVPLFAGLVAIPALFLVPGSPIATISLGPVALTISDNALLSFATLLIRVTASVTAAVVLMMTTRWADLLRALRVIRVPHAFVVVLTMAYRYIFLLLRAVEDLFLGRASRTVGETRSAERRRWIGTGLGTILSKSYQTSSDVHLAMVARGFTGDVRTLRGDSLRDEDWLFVSVSAVVLASALLLDIGLA